jgi:UDP-2,3-diacylglucosamine hydrolase
VNLTLQKLGIIAGGGELPMRIAESCHARGQPYLVIATDEFASEVAPHLSSVRIPIGKLGRGFATLRRNGCRDIVFAGKYERPGGRIPFRPDLTGAWLFIRHIGPFRRSDDTLHRIMAYEFERAGFRVVSPLDADPTLAAPRGCLTRKSPDSYVEADLLQALTAAKAHGQTDEGQAVVVRDRVVIAHEKRAGTDVMLAELSRNGNKGGILAKAMKPGQIRHVDPPAIGASTVAAAAAAGLDGLVIEAGATVVVDLADVVATADRLGLFIVGLEAGAP